MPFVVSPTLATSDPFGLVGTVVDRQFRVDAAVGEGGFGVVYRGWHLALDQPVAIKALKIPEAHDARQQAALLAQFRDEAKISYVLSQATLNVVRTIDFGATSAPSGAWVPFAVLEWLDGETLAQELKRRRAQGLRGRTPAEALRLLEPAARALGLAHKRRVAHRDVKPGNVFLLAPSASGVTIKVLDFGIAKVMREGSTRSGATVTGAMPFTPFYAAPEQLDQRYGPTGPWTDVYALALVMTELLTDRAPFDAADLPGVTAEVLDPARRPTPRTRGANVPGSVEGVLARALAVDPRARHGDATELWDALEAALGISAPNQPTPLPPPMPAAPTQASPVHVPAAAMLPAVAPPVAHVAAMVPSYAPPVLYAVEPPSPAAGRTANLVALILGIGLALIVLGAVVTWIITRR